MIFYGVCKIIILNSPSDSDDVVFTISVYLSVCLSVVIGPPLDSHPFHLVATHSAAAAPVMSCHLVRRPSGSF